jgi:hypothetical protein
MTVGANDAPYLTIRWSGTEANTISYDLKVQCRPLNSRPLCWLHQTGNIMHWVIQKNIVTTQAEG